MKPVLAILLCVGTTFALANGAAAQTKCMVERYNAVRNGPKPGGTVPDCDSKGNYKAMQCSGSTGYCWCVDTYGNKRYGTDTPPGQHLPNCNIGSSCERERAAAVNQQTLLGAFIPLCDTKGDYLPMQCQTSTQSCWCVDINGLEIENTRSAPAAQPPICMHDGPCTRAYRQAEKNSNGIGAFMPSCNDDGSYLSLQCHGSTGNCWCVDSQGREVAGTRAYPGQVPPICGGDPVPL